MSFRVARVSGVPVVIHVASVVTFVLLSYVIGFGFIAKADPSLSIAGSVMAGAVAALLLFASILAHEYGHVGCARKFGIEARSVSLGLFGGEAKLTCSAGGWCEELLIALAGPAVSAGISGLCAATLFVLTPGSAASIIAFYLTFANALLAGINLIPAYPLDGGRALHALLWGITHDRDKSTRMSAIVGEALGLAAAGYGAYAVITIGADGLLPVIIGWYVFDAALRSKAEEESFSRLRQSGVTPNCSAG